MTLNPRFAGQKLVLGNPSQALHTLELYLDYVCPFSKKMFDTVYTSLLPSLTQQQQPPSQKNLQFIFRPQIQPWHPSSTLAHEAAAAVLRLRPEQFWRFSSALFERQTAFFDEAVAREPRNETYRRLAAVAAEAAGVDEGRVYEMLEIGEGKEGGGSNAGNEVTDDVKLMVKFNRRVGVHVTPTVLFNGIEEGGISSSFTKEQWEEWLEKNIK